MGPCPQIIINLYYKQNMYVHKIITKIKSSYELINKVAGKALS